MFRNKEKAVSEIVLEILRAQGLETPLQQRRLINAWEEIAGTLVARYTGEKFIRNQTLMVKITNPAMRAELGMMRTQLKERLNAKVGAQVIAEIKFY
ncbi:MAG: DUF721 domain-containing protein [Bacteroidales bacterium]|nr:DUF721 domain-containing protein [Bacteroidales bacterium]MCM1146698.1 DUF721 domain-containing protein [Bacteroidales bacterium]MCM1205515.1 DUF721 domain-containing protein [Bacillota bacterium]MCM1509224.1 DUF721 domain-containing protein [Clostridium sp.]